MTIFVIAITMATIAGILAFIFYNYPSKNQNKRHSKAAVLFLIALILSIFGGTYLTYNNFKRRAATKHFEDSLALAIDTSDSNLTFDDSIADSLVDKQNLLTGRFEKESGRSAGGSNAPNDGNQHHPAIRQRKISINDLLPFLKRKEPKDIHIIFKDFEDVNAENSNVRSQIIDLLNGQGYFNIDPVFHTVLGAIAPSKITIDTGAYITIEIPPAKKQH